MGTPAPGCNGTVFNIITPGSGPAVTKGAQVTVHATGVVKETGKKFWSTKDPGQQAFSYQAGVGKATISWHLCPTFRSHMTQGGINPAVKDGFLSTGPRRSTTIETNLGNSLWRKHSSHRHGTSRLLHQG